MSSRDVLQRHGECKSDNVSCWVVLWHREYESDTMLARKVLQRHGEYRADNMSCWVVLQRLWDGKSDNVPGGVELQSGNSHSNGVFRGNVFGGWGVGVRGMSCGNRGEVGGGDGVHCGINYVDKRFANYFNKQCANYFNKQCADYFNKQCANYIGSGSTRLCCVLPEFRGIFHGHADGQQEW